MDNINSTLFIDDDRLFDYAAANARLLAPSGWGSAKAPLCAFQAAYRDIRRCHEEIERRYGALSTPPAACEWLLDNWYMVQREFRAAAPRFSHSRPLRRSGRDSMLLRLCEMLCISGAGLVTEERFKKYMDGFQSVTVLCRAELTLLPSVLSAAVTECIAQVCREMRGSADTLEQAKLLENLFTTLRLFSVLDMEKLLRAVDVIDSILCADPSGDYPKMDSGTRRAYLGQVEKLAKEKGVEEHIFARTVIKRAAEEKRHLGFVLFEDRRFSGAGAYIAANVLLTLFLTLLAAFICSSVPAAPLLLLPVSELIKSLLDHTLLRLVKPRRLFRMDTENGVPAEGRCLCVISTLLGGEENAARLEELYHACKSEGEALCFGLLADLPEADSEKTDGDESLVAPLKEAVTQLNRKYGSRFYLFTRKRSFNGQHYSPRERKRGALLELAKLLCQEPSELEVWGEKDALSGIAYILTLDSDTRIYPGSVGQLIGAALHPLCKPKIDPATNTVVSGHALIHPRIDTELKSAGETDFAIIFAGAGGSDPYGSLCGELYMDAFDCGGFAGKGLIDARALLRCTRSFPAGAILSHDAPEGAYLRGAFMGDAEFSDRFPSRPLAWYKRQHRWIRGDWQNMRFVFDKKLRPIDRWRLFDSLRRSLIAPATLLAIVLGFFMRETGLKVAAWAALLAVLSRLIISLAESALSLRRSGRLRRYTRLLTGVGGAIVQSFIRLWLLPYEAWTAFSAICCALWRMAVSRKNLLQWQTAAQSEGGHGFEAHIKAMWFPIVLGTLLMALCPAVIGKSAGLMWLLSPAAAAALALPSASETPLSGSDREYLLKAAKESYSYFTSFCTSEENYLPPDNYQEQPPMGLARRTSPTNMGLALCAHLAARELGFISPGAFRKRLEQMLDTFEKMPRCMGHFYNWYDTATLKPLLPAYISTVDSGNFYAALLTVYMAVQEPALSDAAGRIRALLEEMDFSPLYDRVRGLFHICYDSAGKKGAGGWYDLMASEAMLTSYIAVARGDVPVKHWRRLSRAQLQKDGYRGLASWTGTMFEYLMPTLFLPLYRGSLLHESGRFCLYAQKRRVWAGKPWGISESAFYSLDSALSYRYKAHGCAALSLKRGQDEEMVVSPYSSFLALALDGAGAVRNLRRLEAFGARGRWGFIEALDFSPGRCRSDSGEQVRCYMAHHVAMSLLSAANALRRGCIQSYFMSSPDMSAYSLLLQERLDEGAVLIRKDSSPIPERFERSSINRWQLRGGSEDTKERSCVLSNGAYSLVCTSHGRSRAFCPPVTVYHWGSTAHESAGMELILERQWESLPLIPCAEAALWELAEDRCCLSGSDGSLQWSYEHCAAYGDCGELRRVTFTSRCGETLALRLSFKPILAMYQDYVNHPAFWELGMEAAVEDNCLIIHRLPRGGCGELWLALSCSGEAEFQADKGGGLGWLSQPLVTARAEVSVRAGEKRELRFALCLAGGKQEAADGARRILVSAVENRGSMVSASAMHLKMSGEEVGAAMELLSWLERPERGSGAPKNALWPYAVSGDLPIICSEAGAVEALPLLRRFCLLKSCGINADLVYFSDEQGEYRQNVSMKISGELDRFSLSSLLNCPGGVHFAPLSAKELITSRAAFAVGREQKQLPAPLSAEAGRERERGCVPRHGWAENAFEFVVRNELPGRVWQQLLSNGSFGYIAADCGSGNMWYKNAREMRITPPPAQHSAVSGSEALWVEKAGERLSLFAANDGLSCRVSYSPGCARWEKELGDGRRVTLTAFIPRTPDARVFIIEGARGLKLGWRLCPLLGSGDAAALSIREERGLLIAENPEAYLPGTSFYALCSTPCQTGFEYEPPAMYISAVGDDVSVLVCGCSNEDELRQLCEVGAAFAALDKTRRHWTALLRRMEIESRSAPLNNYVNLWCAYQCIACRLEGRSSLYQSGGAIGFRDQLQDAANLLLLSTVYARERILDACRHQYPEGDVMHWWHAHPEGDRGVRTRCSDDLLWLVWALCEYCEKTGDYTLCHMKTPYVSSAPLGAGERDRYETPEISTQSETVLQHARKALDCCVSRGFGPHSLPLMGSGDWNDGLDRVEGESVWLGWFLSHCALRFSRLLRLLKQPEAERYERISRKAAKGAEESWCERWYARAWYADGRVLGGRERLDSLSQSWSVLWREGEAGQRPAVAVDSALHRLVDRKNSVVKLFDPPYSADERPCPGYIASYGEGFRENGGQYSHGAVWLAMACFELGRADEGWEILEMLLPAAHELSRYEAEPYVLSADVYSAPGHEGEAGWSWYTGSAGWYFRAVYEQMLGLKLKGGKLRIEPKLPEALGTVRVYWTDTKDVKHSIDISRTSVTVDGLPYDGLEIG